MWLKYLFYFILFYLFFILFYFIFIFIFFFFGGGGYIWPVHPTYQSYYYNYGSKIYSLRRVITAQASHHIHFSSAKFRHNHTNEEFISSASDY